MPAKNTRFVVAIDFGTSRSGYAFAASHDPERTAYSINWPDHPSTLKTEKTPTTLLASADGKIVNYGYPAVKQLSKKRGKDDSSGNILIGMFKMSLHRSDEQGSPKPRTKRGGGSFDTLSLIAEYLRWMRKLAVSQISQSLTAAWDEKEIRWCLTVPAIWSDDAKGLMRQAAIEAGMIDAGAADASRLNLVLEPEAAAIYCQQQTKKSAQFQIQPGRSFMVVDAGGGTVDITTHQVTQTGELDALTEAAGGPFGSMYIDEEFLKWLSRVLGTTAVETLNVSFPEDRLELLERWESSKCRYDGSKEWEDTISLPGGFYKYLQQRHQDALQKLYDLQGGEDYFVRLTSEDMDSIFEPVLTGLVTAVQRQFSKLFAESKRCDYLFLVGGFAESRLLQKRIKHKFDRGNGGPALVVVPENPGRSILGGAVAYGLNPGLIRTRRSRYTYGVGTGMVLDKTLDAGRKTFTNDENVVYCDDRFMIYVSRGQSVPSGRPVTCTIYPAHSHMPSMDFELYRTRKHSPRYIDESEVTSLNKKLVLNLPAGKTKQERRAEISMYFGDTEVRVEAVQPTTGQKVEAVFDLASCFFPEDME